MQKSLHLDPAKCTGCLQCEMACSYENYGVFNPAKSRIKVFEFHETGRKVPYTCTQCDEAWYLHACPVEAIKVDAATGAKVVLEDVCVGCKVCTIACPFGTIKNARNSSGRCASVRKTLGMKPAFSCTSRMRARMSSGKSWSFGTG
jgi:Fe-S-cluster-containing hydrogenase component 2